MTDSACPVSGSYTPLTNRPAFAGTPLCNECFDDCDVLDDVPEDWDLVRTYSGSSLTIHRDADDVDGVLSHQSRDTSGYSKPSSKLDSMDLDEFDRLVGGDV